MLPRGLGGGKIAMDLDCMIVPDDHTVNDGTDDVLAFSI
jgi:hypothetical protein